MITKNDCRWLVVTGLVLGFMLGVLTVMASAQTKVYTKYDLGKPISHTTPPPSPQVWRGIVERQYRWYPPADGIGPVVSIAQYSGSGPWKFPKPAPPRRLDGTLLSDPPTVYGLPPWYSYSYPYFSPGYSSIIGPQRQSRKH